MSHTVSRLHRRRMGEILVSEGLISGDQLDQALTQQRLTGERLGSILIDMGLITETDITKTLSAQYQVPFLTFDNYEPEPKLVARFPAPFLHQHQILPFDAVGNTLLVLVGEIPPLEVLEEVGKRTGMNVALYVGYRTEVMSELTKLAPLAEPEKSTKGRPDGSAPAAPGGPHAAAVTDDVDSMLFGTDSDNIMEQLDSTWNSIFQEVDADDDDD